MGQATPYACLLQERRRDQGPDSAAGSAQAALPCDSREKVAWNEGPSRSPRALQSRGRARPPQAGASLSAGSLRGRCCRRSERPVCPSCLRGASQAPARRLLTVGFRLRRSQTAQSQSRGGSALRSTRGIKSKLGPVTFLAVCAPVPSDPLCQPDLRPSCPSAASRSQASSAALHSGRETLLCKSMDAIRFTCKGNACVCVFVHVCACEFVCMFICVCDSRTPGGWVSTVGFRGGRAGAEEARG